MIKKFRYGESDNLEIFSRAAMPVDTAEVVSGIINDVKTNGDAALKKYTLKFDKAELETFRVSDEEIREAYDVTDPYLTETIRQAAANIRRFHEKQVRNGFALTDESGTVIGQKVIPIEKVGLYVPGGTAAYPSTVLMDSIPAIIAGCSKVVITTPPDREGKIKPSLLVAADIAGVQEIYKVGGAQAIAALAYGTETIPKVDKIVGPGNAYVAEAKRQVFGKVSIDMIAGPSEILIVADKDADPSFVAADLLSQAEHDKNASAVLITDSEDLAESVSKELEKQLPLLERYEIARTSIDVNGKIIVAENIDTALEISNEIAPEHLELAVRNPFDYLGKVRNAGSVFMGYYCPEALGDYFAGPNHTLPTGGTAKFSSPLSVDDFVKKTQFTYYTEKALSEVAENIRVFACEEGLTGHAKSVTTRFEDK